jgi:membrane protease YdiL (CAAX protease family)
MSKLIRDYLIVTFSIMILGWGTCLSFSANGLSLGEYPLLNVPYLLGGWSPTISAYVVQKKHKKVKGFKDWLKKLFAVKQSLAGYAIVVALAVIFILAQCLISGYVDGAPLFAIGFLLPMMLIGGGLEEAGWRGALQPELEKKHGFVISTLIVFAVWLLWHLPLFFTLGASQFGKSYLVFAVMVLGISFALAAIRKTTNSVWLCVVFHCLNNALASIFIINDNLLGASISTAVLLVLSSCLMKCRGLSFRA